MFYGVDAGMVVAAMYEVDSTDAKNIKVIVTRPCNSLLVTLGKFLTAEFNSTKNLTHSLSQDCLYLKLGFPVFILAPRISPQLLSQASLTGTQAEQQS